MGGFPSLGQKLRLGPIGTSTNAIDGDEHRFIASFAIGHREAGFRMRNYNVAVVYQFDV